MPNLVKRPFQIKKFPYQKWILIGQFVRQLYLIVVQYSRFRQTFGWALKEVCITTDGRFKHFVCIQTDRRHLKGCLKFQSYELWQIPYNERSRRGWFKRTIFLLFLNKI